MLEILVECLKSGGSDTIGQGIVIPMFITLDYVGKGVVDKAVFVFLQFFEDADAGTAALFVEVIGGKAVPSKEGIEFLDKLPALGFKRLGLLAKKVERFFVLFLGLKMICLVFLVSLFRKKLYDELIDVFGDFEALLVVKLCLAEVLNNFGQVGIGASYLFSKAIGDGFGYILLVDTDIVLGRQMEVLGKGSSQPLHERVDGADAEAAVIVEDVLEEQLGVGFQGLPADVELFNQVGFHALGRLARIAMDDVVELLHNLVLHLVGRLVGEGDGEDMAEIGRGVAVFQAQLEIFLDNGIGFP